jgi:NAD(P)-dependent dehydrogenase (short-subunit alcohol dehydrogenase family)
VVRQVEVLGGQGLFIRTDVSKQADVKALAAAIVDRFGRLDCAINNAGIAGSAMVPAGAIEEDDRDATMAVNLKKVFLSMQYEIPGMLQNGGGAIVNVASVYGLKLTNVGGAAYSATKFGKVGLTKNAAIAYARQGIGSTRFVQALRIRKWWTLFSKTRPSCCER